MRMRVVIAVTLAATITSAVADDRKFSASDVPNAKLRNHGRIVIKNTINHITAYRFFGDIREALVNLRATRRVATMPFGSTVFDSRASLRAVPAHYAPIINQA